MIQFSVIIPVLHESRDINEFVSDVKRISPNMTELIVVDGAPEADTIKALTTPEVTCMTASKGRASQMNAGAEKAGGRILVFLHADTKLPENAFCLIEETLKDDRFVGGAFRLGIDSKSFLLGFLAWSANIRTRFTHVPYGDQAIFMKRDYFNMIGGYHSIPILEDLELMQRVKKRKNRINILKKKVLTSARRWEEEGLLRRTICNWFILIKYYCGTPPEKLTRYLNYKKDDRKFLEFKGQ